LLAHVAVTERKGASEERERDVSDAMLLAKNAGM
jgi:hypothetical protein